MSSDNKFPCPTKEEIELRVKAQHVQYFENLRHNEWDYEGFEVDTESDGDGCEARMIFKFAQHDLSVMLVGTYSSWNDTTYDTIHFVESVPVYRTSYKIIHR